ncbi:MAG: hypothetical protein A2X52_09300 [Candidatus Rokubacteria bacterium GWC2_70_16]|nr:MAG: hypothetical protein A2X52_09300 [Candidatus Rokubacteria bacterium GWC2_70_16]OGL20951.1 MAG: hypothetical protein A3K12_05700 [Candidatus Rokubacteria bacterium RIFCSPLOWO2_12_FULL_71_19]
MRPLMIAATVLALLAPALVAEGQTKPMTPPAPAQAAAPSPAQPADQQSQHHPQQSQATPTPKPRPRSQQQQMMGGMMGQGMMGGQGMMMCPMMGGMMGQGMMGSQGMMGGQGMPGMARGSGIMRGPVDMSDPKAAARTLKLRGDLMKAVGEIMLKHAEALAQEK